MWWVRAAGTTTAVVTTCGVSPTTPRTLGLTGPAPGTSSRVWLSESDAASVVISDEHLAALTPQQVERAVSALASREVHVVYATRNLARLLPSEWQEYIKHGSKLTFGDWTQKVFNSREKGPGKWFWSVHDPVDVIDRWSSHVPVEHIHVITLPLPGADKNELWRRFCGVVDVDPSVATEFEVAGNDSLGVAEAELLRRVNEALPETFPIWHHRFLGRDVLATKILSPRSKGGKAAASRGGPTPCPEALAAGRSKACGPRGSTWSATCQR